MSKNAVKPYIKAMVDLIRPDQKKEKISSQIRLLHQLFQSYPFFIAFLSSPLSTNDQKKKFIETIKIKLNLENIVYNFLCLIIQQNRTKSLLYVLNRLNEELDDLSNKVTVKMTLPSFVNDEQLNMFNKTFRKALGKEIEIKFLEDPSIVGGFILDMGSLRIDGSWLTQLNEMQKMISEIKI